MFWVLDEVRFCYVSSYDPLRLEVVGDFCDGVFHEVYPCVFLAVKSGTIRYSSLLYRSWSSSSLLSLSLSSSLGCGPIAQPVTPSMQPSIHQPSSTLKLTTPLWAAFMPLVPEASKGGKGVLSQTSTPEVSFAASPCHNSLSKRCRSALQRACVVVDLPYESLAVGVVGVGFSSENHLDFFFPVNVV